MVLHSVSIVLQLSALRIVIHELSPKLLVIAAVKWSEEEHLCLSTLTFAFERIIAHHVEVYTCCLSTNNAVIIQWK